MSIASAITAAQGRVADCYTAISNKGGTLPATQNLSNMPTAIGSIETINATTASVTPTTSAQTITPTSPYNAFDEISVSAVTSSIDNNITAGNIKSGVSILGVSGSLTPLNGTTLSVTPTTSAQSLTPISPYNGYTSVSVSAVTASIDANITAGNIKKDVQILGVTGTYEGGGGAELAPYQISNGVASRRSVALTGNEFSGVTSIGDYGFYKTFYLCTGITGSVDLSNVTSVGLSGLDGAFYRCTGITGSVDLSSVTSIGNSGLNEAFRQSKITSVVLSGTKSVGNNGLYNTFYRCSNLSGTINCSGITSLGNYGMMYCFSECEEITSINLSGITSLGSSCFTGAFGYCRKLTSIYFNSLTTSSFGSYTNQFSSMFDSGTAYKSGTCTVHFPSNLQSKVSSMTGYPTFGGNSSRIVIAFDLPATS